MFRLWVFFPGCSVCLQGILQTMDHTAWVLRKLTRSHSVQTRGVALSVAGRMWNIFIIAVCSSISTLFPSVNTEHGAAHQTGPAKTPPQPAVTSKHARHGHFAQGWGSGSGVTPLLQVLESLLEAGQCLEQDGDKAGVRGFQQQGAEPRLGCSLRGFFCTTLTYLQNPFDEQHFGAFSAQMIFKLLR